MSGNHYRQFCALARAAEIVGERWTLLIIRELLIGPKRFSDLLDHLGGMSPTLLTARLAALIENGMVRKVDVAWACQRVGLRADRIRTRNSAARSVS